MAQRASFQNSLFRDKWSRKLSFGGLQKAKGNPRGARPISTRSPMHLVLKSNWAQGRYSFLGKMKALESLCRRIGSRTAVKLYDLAIAANHLHLIIRPKSIHAYRAFVRALSGLIPRLMMNAQRGRRLKDLLRRLRSERAVQSRGEFPVKSLKARLEELPTSNSFWQARPFTRIVSWGKDYATLKNYLMKNRLDLVGMTREAAREMLRVIEGFQVKLQT